MSAGCSEATTPKAIDVTAELEEGVLQLSQAAGDLLGLGSDEPVFEEELPARKFTVPYVVRAGGAILTVCAGITNAVSFLSLAAFTSHATGTLSKVAMGLQGDDRFDPGALALLLVAFMAGSTLCGVFIGKNKVHFGLALYDFGLLSVSGLLVLAFVTAEGNLARYFSAAACGLQNGLATEWGGASIRTTHVTGLLTDVGLLIGRMFSMLARKRCGKGFDIIDRGLFADDRSKLGVLTTLGISFLLGTYLGAVLHNEWQEKAFLVPAGVTGFVGFAYLFYRVRILHQRIFSVEEMEIVDVPMGIVVENASKPLAKSLRSRTKDLVEASLPQTGMTDHKHAMQHTCSAYAENVVVGVSRGEMLKLMRSTSNVSRQGLHAQVGAPAPSLQASPEDKAKLDAAPPQVQDSAAPSEPDANTLSL